MKQNRTILWLEDRPETVITQAEIVSDKGFKIELCPNLVDFMQTLEELQEDKSNTIISGIILDVFVYGARDISILGDTFDTNQGVDAGWKLLVYVLSNTIFFNTPILLYSVRALSQDKIELLQKLNANRLSPISYSEKYSDSADFCYWIESIASNC